MNSRLPTFVVAAPCETVFNFLADIENLPVWLGGFCEWIELHRDGWWAYTAIGELEARMKAADLKGEIQLDLRHVSGREFVISLWVRSNGRGGSCVSLGGAASAERDDRLSAALRTGLIGLSLRLRPELAVNN